MLPESTITIEGVMWSFTVGIILGALVYHFAKSIIGEGHDRKQ